jgi:membrane associated rhomboid family serine protease
VFPYHDENETVRTAYVTYALVALNVAMWVLVQGAGSAVPLATSVCNLGLIPGEFTLSVPPGAGFPMGDGLVCLTDPGRQVPNVITSMFLHGSWMHLIGNMWFLWLFGNNVEDSMTRPRFAIFYVLCGLGAALLQIWMQPESIVPMVGASGAISGVMGAYLILYPRVRVFTFVPLGFIFTSVALPAWVMLIYWMALQLLGGFTRIGGGQEGGVAFWAHVGGFLAGAIFIKLFERKDHVRMHRAQHWEPDRVGWQ